MTNLEPLSQTPLKKIPNVLVLIFLILSLVGFLDATYLTAKHYVGDPVVCPIFGGCEDVLSRTYSMIWFVPVALLGALYYGLILFLVVAYLDSQKVYFLKWAAYITILGLLASLWFMFVQVFLIKALCFYCVVSAITSALLFIFGQIILKIHNTKNPEA